MPSVMPPVVEFDADLIARLGKPGPRYSSYPTADRFSESFGYRDYLHAVAGLRTRASARPLSLYVHVPLCNAVCHHCACNGIVARRRERAATYLCYLKREIEMQGRLFAGMNAVEQVHFGGGTPSYLSDAQMGELVDHLRHCFRFAPDAAGEYSIDVDPRTVSRERVHSLRRQGFNRISLGVLDLAPEVQKSAERAQPQAETHEIIAAAREAGFRSVGIDLIYGLPKQTIDTMRATLDKVIDAGPDRIAVYRDAYPPRLVKPQRRILDADLPGNDTSLRMHQLCFERLGEAGYVYIGMDHFAKPNDDLAVAQRQGRLHRNFQGYSTHAASDLVGCGVSAISAVGATCSRNARDLEAYYEAIDCNELPVERGLRLSMDDLLRRTVIEKLMCDFELSIPAIEQAFPIAFDTYFQRERVQLVQLERDGLIELGPDTIGVSAKGRLLICNVCMLFDRYLAHGATGAQHAMTV